jgi:hypothetical protein
MRDSSLFNPCFDDMGNVLICRLGFDALHGYQVGHEQSQLHVYGLLFQFIASVLGRETCPMALASAVRTA